MFDNFNKIRTKNEAAGVLFARKDVSNKRIELAWIHSTLYFPVCVNSIHWNEPKYFENTQNIWNKERGIVQEIFV